ncbi:cyanophycinase [Leptolyngbya sp. FACHB-711]|jgi:cyanophycinase|uniref:cyanophycinase n=1 Tax=unclassified Leptolyngbya TaxID=2650499 RepID=UPI001687BCCC|nr:cyanophycinase [Leptolyngbya sp. FACHB-711]MBD1853774.1 cyanophycinase [Cyanobacteria bacterium FACHB-502]MBD2027294.1 cyanophycinase [Leptolyngbya sp. FACHB-711]
MVESTEKPFTSGADSVELPETHGALIIIGGAEDKDGDCKILREFVRRAGGLQARIAIMTVATGSPREVGDRYTEVFRRLGVEDVRAVDTSRREDSSDRDVLSAVENATGIFFTGGDQARILEIIKDTELDDLLHKRLAGGAVVAGTSAGAAMMPDKMIVVGESETNPRPDTVEIDRGMGFLPNVVIDQHFAQRGRLGRLLTALALEPATIGFGIDENTAIIVDGHIVEVVGESSVTIVDESEATLNNVNELLKDEPLALGGIKLHILPAGFRFDLRTRSCVC